MRRYVLATHGKMADGLKSTAEIIIGPQENLICINAYTEECPDPTPEYLKILAQYPEDDIVIMTDIFGGSVNNNAMVLTGEDRVHVVTGTNLALFISLIMSDPEEHTEKVIKEAVSGAKEKILYCNEISCTGEGEEEDF